MKISFKSGLVTFASINPGECFVVENGDVFIKTQANILDANNSYGCDLQYGVLKHFDDNLFVHPIKLEAIEV